MKRIALVALSLIASCGFHAHGSVAFSERIDFSYDEAFVESSGDVDKLIFSVDFEFPALSSLDFVGIDLSHGTAGELRFRISTPTGVVYDILDADGAATFIGDGSGLLSGLARYTFVDGFGVFPNAADWDFTGSQPGGTYNAGDWPEGAWPAGRWNLALFNDDVHSVSPNPVGAVGSFVVGGTAVPEPTTGLLALLGGLLLYGKRSRNVWSEQGVADQRTARCE